MFRKFFKFYLKYYKSIIQVFLVLFLINEVLLLITYREQSNVVHIVNEASKQRLYSKQIANLILLYQNDLLNDLSELEKVVQEWSDLHNEFYDKDSTISKISYDSNIEGLVIRINPFYHDIYRNLQIILSSPDKDHSKLINELLEKEKLYIALKNEIIDEMASNASLKSRNLLFWELILGTLTFIGFGYTIVFMLNPMLSELKVKEKAQRKLLKEKDSLLAEVHHRVKNNLAVISGIFQLQILKRDFSSYAFADAVTRVQSIAGIHELLYKEQEFSSVSIEKYIAKLIDLLSKSNSEIGKDVQMDVSATSIHLDMEKAVPFALLLNELITNSLKHAFKSIDNGRIKITISIHDDDQILFTYSDNGIGFEPQDEISDSIGMQLINALSDQLDANVQVNSKAGYNFQAVFNK